MTLGDESDAERWLARELAHKATLAPGGTRWPGFTAPTRHRCYAIIGLHLGGRLMGGGASPEAAYGALARALLRKARATARS